MILARSTALENFGGFGNITNSAISAEALASVRGFPNLRTLSFSIFPMVVEARLNWLQQRALAGDLVKVSFLSNGVSGKVEVKVFIR